MYLKNKIIAATLCALVAGIGFFAAPAGIVRAENATAAVNPAITIEQLQEIVNSLKAQIEQLIQLISQQKKLNPVCGNAICEASKGETASDCQADCMCPLASPPKCAEGTVIGLTYMDYHGIKCQTSTCVKSTCLQEGGASYTSNNQYTGCCAGLQKNWINSGPTTPKYSCSKCGNGKCDFGETNSNCGIDCFCGDGRCDANETDTGCAKDCANTCKKAGEGITSLTASCCSGLTATSNSRRPGNQGNCEDITGSGGGSGGSACIKCGDGICGTGENKCNCEKDCSGDNTCAGEGQKISTGGNKCCTGLEAVSACNNLEGSNCVADSWTCTKTTTCTTIANLGGTLKFTPSVYALNDKLYVSGIGSDSALWIYEYSVKDPTKNVPWYSLGGALTSGTEMSAVGSSLGVFLTIQAIGTDKNLWQRSSGANIANWEPWILSSTVSTDTTEKFVTGPTQTILSANTNDPTYGYIYKAILNNDKSASIIACTKPTGTGGGGHGTTTTVGAANTGWIGTVGNTTGTAAVHFSGGNYGTSTGTGAVYSTGGNTGASVGSGAGTVVGYSAGGNTGTTVKLGTYAGGNTGTSGGSGDGTVIGYSAGGTSGGSGAGTVIGYSAGGTTGTTVKLGAPTTTAGGTSTGYNFSAGSTGTTGYSVSGNTGTASASNQSGSNSPAQDYDTWYGWATSW